MRPGRPAIGCVVLTGSGAGSSRPTGAPELTCGRGGVLPTIYTVLDYGQTRTAGAITCSSAPEPAGITCTNADSGHFFRVSQASYQIG